MSAAYTNVDMHPPTLQEIPILAEGLADISYEATLLRKRPFRGGTTQGLIFLLKRGCRFLVRVMLLSRAHGAVVMKFRHCTH